MIRTLPALAFYLGIGAACYALFVAERFDWSSAWTYAWLLAWPVVLLASFWAFILLALLVVALLMVPAFMLIAARDARRRRASVRRPLR